MCPISNESGESSTPAVWICRVLPKRTADNNPFTCFNFLSCSHDLIFSLVNKFKYLLLLGFLNTLQSLLHYSISYLPKIEVESRFQHGRRSHDGRLRSNVHVSCICKYRTTISREILRLMLVQKPQPTPQAEQDPEKGSSPTPKVYGTFITRLRSKISDEKSQMIEQQGSQDNVWWAFGVSLLVVGTIAVYAFVIISALLWLITRTLRSICKIRGHSLHKP